MSCMQLQLQYGDISCPLHLSARPTSRALWLFARFLRHLRPGDIASPAARCPALRIDTPSRSGDSALDSRE